MPVQRIDHILIAMPPGREDEARAFYHGILGLAERSSRRSLLRARAVGLKAETCRSIWASKRISSRRARRIRLSSSMTLRAW